MTRAVLIPRPREQASETALGLRARGYTPVFAPVLQITPCAWAAPAHTPQAILLTSMNGARALASSTLARSIPVYAVGEKTAALAQAAGFSSVQHASGGAEALAGLVKVACKPTAGRLLYLRGRDVAYELEAALEAQGFGVDACVVYNADPLSGLPADVQLALAAGKIYGALLYSERSAHTLAGLVPHDRLELFCMSAKIAAAAGTGWKAVHIAAALDENSLLQLLPKV